MRRLTIRFSRPRCGGRLVPVAAILDDKQLARLLPQFGIAADFPKLLPARSPPRVPDEGSQEGADSGLYDGIDPAPPDDGLQAPSGDHFGA